FAGQLQIRLACEGALPPAQAPRYDGRYLKAAFRSYYACQGETGRIYPSSKPAGFHLRIVPMLRLSAASFSYEFDDRYAAEYSRQPAVALGADAEYLLSVFGRRLALCAELAVQQFSGTAGNERWQDIQLRYRSLEMLAGLRLYPFSRPGRPYHPYLTAGYMIPVAVLGDSYISYPFGRQFKMSPEGMPCFAAGMCYKRFGGELRYYLPQDVLTAENAYWTNSFQSFGIAASFQLF
ncbi:MAG: hypothetical protein NW241_21630, partial [Bacteroidia bacterium]|nr:hypothetical protein [Bacteroidia bacterium]